MNPNQNRDSNINYLCSKFFTNWLDCKKTITSSCSHCQMENANRTFFTITERNNSIKLMIMNSNNVHGYISPPSAWLGREKCGSHFQHCEIKQQFVKKCWRRRSCYFGKVSVCVCVCVNVFVCMHQQNESFFHRSAHIHGFNEIFLWIINSFIKQLSKNKQINERKSFHRRTSHEVFCFST
jgi:hypothetical protein